MEENNITAKKPPDPFPASTIIWNPSSGFSESQWSQKRSEWIELNLCLREDAISHSKYI